MLLCSYPANLQLHNLLGNRARELFKCSKDAASLVDCNEKKMGKF